MTICNDSRRNGAGSEAVEWLMSQGVARTAAEAVQLGNALLEHGLLEHVVRPCFRGTTRHIHIWAARLWGNQLSRTRW